MLNIAKKIIMYLFTISLSKLTTDKYNILRSPELLDGDILGDILSVKVLFWDIDILIFLFLFIYNILFLLNYKLFYFN